MRNNRGFTLVEVLAMLVVLGIILAITVPNITGILSNNKINLIKEDALNMIEDAKIEFSTDEDVKYPETGKCVIFTLDRLDKNSDIDEGINGGSYSRTKSFVVVTKENKQYVYYARLVEETDTGLYGIKFASEEQINNSAKKQLSEFSDGVNFNVTTSNENEALESAKNILGSSSDSINCSSSNLTGFYN